MNNDPSQACFSQEKLTATTMRGLFILRICRSQIQILYSYDFLVCTISIERNDEIRRDAIRMDNERVASDLKGNTLRVYWCLLESSKSFLGPRAVQRKLGFSSPALAVYHLEKLSELGLVEKVSGEYQLTKMVEVGILKQFMKFKGFIIPRNVLYATMLTTLFAFYLTQFREVNFYSIFALIFGLLSSSILWFETIRVWRNKP